MGESPTPRAADLVRRDLGCAAFFGLRNASEHDSDAGRESGPLVTYAWPRIGLRDGTVPVRAIAEVALSARNQGLPGRTRRSTHRNDNPPAANAEHTVKGKQHERHQA